MNERIVIGKVLKDQALTNFELLYDKFMGKTYSIKEEKKEESKIRFRTDRERLEAGDHICLNCRYWKNKCISKMFKGDENLWIMECIAEHYKYWEPKDNG